jgi:P pilus assembly chaperone PapD
MMKLTIRIFALTVIVAGAAAAATTPKTTRPIASHQSATASFPTPTCDPYVCPSDHSTH